jgi:hypothetical protein
MSYSFAFASWVIQVLDSVTRLLDGTTHRFCTVTQLLVGTTHRFCTVTQLLGGVLTLLEYRETLRADPYFKLWRKLIDRHCIRS